MAVYFEQIILLAKIQSQFELGSKPNGAYLPRNITIAVEIFQNGVFAEVPK